MPVPNSVNADVVALLRGTLTKHEVAERHGVTESEVEVWRELMLSGLEAQRPQRRWGIGALVALAAVGFGSFATRAFAGTCASTLPAPLVTLCPNEPALASEMNGNFAQIVTWVQQKVGTVGTAAITASSLTTTGTVSAGGVTATGLTVNGNTTVNGSTTLNGAANVTGNLSVGGTSLGTWSTGLSNDTEYTAATDGFVSAYFYANSNGARCFFHGYSDGAIRATGGLHYFTSSDVYVTDDSIFYPVRRGSRWRVNLFNTSGTCNVNIMWMPLHP